MDGLVNISKEVKEVLSDKGAVVALESTIISHGMPYPQNVDTALKVEETVRKNGAVPATIAIINGVATVGLSGEQIEYLGKQGRNAIKCSRRDIPYVISQKADGALTVASTMIFSQMAGIRVFATGGIGGVHRGAQTSMDISADLDELSKTDVAVVCAGVKSILDIGLTLEYLETKGVAVIGYKTNIMPAFYTSESDFFTTFSLESPSRIADFLNTKKALGLGGGTVVANPVPKEFSMDRALIDAAIDKALEKCASLNIRGKETTPFLLAEIKDITLGESLESNIHLVLNNAKLAAQIASEL